jgi:hypothetical protein
MGKETKKLTMDRPAIYQIKVPGVLSNDWSNWNMKIEVNIEIADKRAPITTLTGNLDQAALLGLLRQLNSLGLPLISVICIENGLEE